MTDISITAGNVVPGSDAVIENGYAGEAITAGQVVYFDTSTRKWMKADANAATAAARQPSGIALNGASANQPIAVQTKGSLTIGGTLTAGVTYYLSSDAGGICPIADVGSGEYYCTVGIATSASVLKIGFNYSGVAA